MSSSRPSTSSEPQSKGDYRESNAEEVDDEHLGMPFEGDDELPLEPEIDINEFFEHIGMDKEMKFTEKTMREFEEDMDFENKTPRDKIVFVPAKRFSNFNYHYILETYLPFTVDLSCMSLKSLDGIEFMFFISYVNAGSNLLTNDGLQYIEYLDDLIALVVDNNKLKILSIPTLDQLMYLDVSDNNITSIDPAINLPSLETLIINSNRLENITLLDRYHLPKLAFLSAVNNFVKDLNVQWSRYLTILYLGGNEIIDTRGLGGLYKLRTLHLRGNHIWSLSEFPVDLVSLEYLNLRSNQISEISTLERLTELPQLRTLILTGNPCTFYGESEEGYRVQVISTLPKLKRLDKSYVTEEELYKAEMLKRNFPEEGNESRTSPRTDDYY